jgi:hypothetical protein
MFSLCSHRVKRIQQIEIWFSTGLRGLGRRASFAMTSAIVAPVGPRTKRDASGTKTIPGA